MKDMVLMNANSCETDWLHEKKQKIVSLRPLIHCITNIVTVNDCANILLAMGASPTMAHHPEEVAEVAANCGALVLNMGATECLDAMEIAGMAAKKAGKAVVLDPVGASGSEFRRKQTLHLIETVKPDCIRGNISELKALAKDAIVCRGVDAEQEVGAENAFLTEYANKTGAVLIASGAVDYVAVPSEKRILYGVFGGSTMMTKVTGTGCMQSALLGAFLASEVSTEALLACLQIMKLCAKRAEEKTMATEGGTMQFRLNFIDEIYRF